MFVQLAVTHIANIADDGILKVNCRLTKHYPFLIERKNSVLCVEKKLNIICGNIIQEDRMLVSTDTELSWLSLFSNLSSPSHQLVGVPVYEDGGSCGKYGGGSPVRESWKTSNIR